MAGGAAIALLGLGIGVPQLAATGAALAVGTLLASFAVRSLRRQVPSRPVKPVRETFAYRWSRSIQRHPVRYLVTGTLILLILASPILGLRLGFSDEGNASEGTATRSAYDLLADGFGAGFNGPFIVTVEPSGRARSAPSTPFEMLSSRLRESRLSPSRSSTTRRTHERRS